MPDSPSRSSSTTLLPLNGLRVVELGQNLAGPIAGEILAHLGADVVKVERPGPGDDARGWGPPFIDGSAPAFHAVNQSKRSITLDLKDPDDREWLVAYLARADIFVHNLRPGVVDSLGLDAKTLTERHPRLIYCALSAYGDRGPMAERPGYEPILQAFSGLMMQSGEPDGPPIRMGTQLLDQGTGMWSAIGILAAVEQRHRTGKGCSVDTSLFETALGWLSMAFAGYNATGDLPQRHPTGSSRLIVFQGFEAKDGPVIIAAGNDRLFAKLAVALGRPEWADDARFEQNAGRYEHKDYLLSEIAAIVATEPRDVWIERLTASGVPCAPVQNIREVDDHPQTDAVGLVLESPTPEVRVIGLPIRFDGERPGIRSAAPKVGEHTASIRDTGSKTKP